MAADHRLGESTVMRYERYQMAHAEAVALFENSEVIHVAAVKPDGEPMFRTVHGVVVDGHVAFHGSPKGEKASLEGWRCVVAVERIVARIPSHFIDPERACAATTYYLSAQVKGSFSEVVEPARKALVLQRLMDRYQPEGLSVFELPLAEVVGKKKLGQNRSKAEIEGVLTQLWARGAPGDLEAITLIRAAHPEAPEPSFLDAEHGLQLVPALGAEAVEATVALLEKQYWNLGVPREQLAKAHLASTAWVGARSVGGSLIATARAVSDAEKRAWIYDVCVDDAWRGRGVGRRLMAMLLDHPAVRRARFVHLATRDAQSFYTGFGFTEHAAVGGGSGSTFMTFDRSTLARSAA